MIVYGDHTRLADPNRLRGELVEGLSSIDAPPIEAHALLVGALIEAGQLVQCIADRTSRELDRDGAHELAHRLMTLTVRLAAAVGRSWSGGLRSPVPDFAEAAAVLHGLDDMEVREPEGYTHYALYPEAYWQAAREWRPGPGAQVIGIRSIGTSLAAVVAAAVEAPVPLTVRPSGHPFARQLQLEPALAARFGTTHAGAVAIVDEGPGLSGSSFAAVDAMLATRGVAPDQITFFPSHPHGPGLQAPEPVRARWSAARCITCSFEDIVLAPQPPRVGLSGWVADLTGSPDAPLADIAGGRWRALGGTDPARWPPADAPGERRKYLLHGTQGDLLLKFTGLGRGGLERFAMQQSLGRAGFVPVPLAWRHGFTVEHWRRDLAPFRPDLVDRWRLIERIGDYLGFRARHLPAEGRSGASLDDLLEMLATNAGEALGPDVGDVRRAWRGRLRRLGPAVRRMVTDNRLHAWEWLVDSDGRLFKTDAVDHHVSHDLIGCQDVAWDLAGAATEFTLTPEEMERLCDRVVRTSGHPIDAGLLSFCGAAYPAFQLAAAQRAAERTEAADRLLWLEQAGRYRAALRRALAG